MDIEAALELADALVFAKTEKHLDDLQTAIFRGAWEGNSFTKIAESCNYHDSHAKEVGSDLWKLLSSALGEKVTKKNLKTPLERRWKAQQSRKVLTPENSVTDRIQPSPLELQNHNQTSNRGVFIPNPRCRQVWGRDDLIEEVLHRLTDSQELPILSLSGSAGYGKTEAAGQIARKALNKNLFADVLWIKARSSELVDGYISQEKRYEALDWNKFLDEIAHQLSCPVDRVHQHLREEKRLIVLDNAETAQVEDILANIVDMLNPSRVLLTSRLKTKPQYVRLIPISGLQERWSYRLLQDEAESNNIPVLLQASDDQLHRVHQLSCGAPLALHFIVGRVLDDHALEPVLSALEQASGDVEVFYQFSLETAWQRVSDTAKSVLRYLGRADAGVTFAELFGAWGVLESDWNQAQRELRRWYLIEDTEDTQGNRRYDLHPWVRCSLRGGLVDNWQPSLQDLEQIAKWMFDIDM